MTTTGGFDVVERPEYMQGLSELGLFPEQIEEIVLQFTPMDYVKGPEEDIKYPNQNVWIFGYDVQGAEFYIKLSDDFSNKRARCISFHRAKFSMIYPYKT
jgi:hypothetical protein